MGTFCAPEYELIEEPSVISDKRNRSLRESKLTGKLQAQHMGIKQKKQHYRCNVIDRRCPSTIHGCSAQLVVLLMSNA